VIKIRKAKSSDKDVIWSIFSAVIKTGDTYVFDPNTDKTSLDKHWLAEYMTTFVALENEAIVGTYIIKPNMIDLGNHIANCSYMVSPKAQSKGIGTKMCVHSIEFAKQEGYGAMQFNIVVSTNTIAVELWKKFGFEIIGTTPNGFRHQQLGLVDTYIMFKKL